MNEKCVLAIDVGTQSMRGCVISAKGDVLVKEQIKYPPYKCLQPGYVEQSAQLYWQVLCKITNALCQKHPELMQNVLAMSVSTFRDTAVLLNEHNEPVRDCILWSDQRSASNSEKLPLFQKIVLGIVRQDRVAIAVRKRMRTRWVMQNEPEIWAKVKKVPHLSGWLNYKLTGNLIDTYSSMVGHLPFDCKRKRWLKKTDLLYPLYEIPIEYMTELCSPGDVMGEITHQASLETGLAQGLKVIASGSDKGCETLGLGCLNENVAAVSFGTATSVQFSTRRHFEPEPLLPSYPSVLKDYYNPEVQIFRGFWTVSWFIENFAKDCKIEAEKLGVAPEELLNREMEKIPAGCNGLVLQPFWQGGLTNPEARGSIVGFTDGHTRAHLYRAMIEGINMAIREGLERLEKRGKKHIDFIAVSGGGSQCDSICQMCANITNRPVRRPQSFENTAIGEAIATFVALGEFETPQQAVESMVHYKDEFLPQRDQVQIYDDLYKSIYIKLYKKLQKFYLKLDSEN